DAQGPASALTLTPLALTPTVPPPTGRLRLLDNLFSVAATDASGAALAATNPLTVIVRPSDAALAAVGGDVSQLVLAYLDPVSNTWLSLPTLLDPSGSGSLIAQAPAPGTLAVFRQAATFWVSPIADLPLTADPGADPFASVPVASVPAGATLEVLASQGSAYQVRLEDGSLAWLDGTQVTALAAPDALPPIPPPPATAAPQPDASVPADPALAAADQAAPAEPPAPALAATDLAPADVAWAGEVATEVGLAEAAADLAAQTMASLGDDRRPGAQ
ncbi:MAG TPA: hypothetical protein VGE94_19225, partial [Chloroflexota bacterium]